MQKPLVTFLLPTYNRAQLITRTIQSIITQTNPRWTLKIFDNASTDSTQSCIQRYADIDNRITYTKHNKNIGMLNNFSQALIDIETPYFCFISDDDFYLPNFVELMLDLYEKHPQIGMAACQVIMTNQKTQVSFPTIAPVGVFESIKGVEAMLRTNSTPYFFGVLFSTSLLQKVPHLEPRVGFIFDQDLILRCGCYASCAISSEAAVCRLDWDEAQTKMLTSFDFLKDWSRLTASLILECSYTKQDSSLIYKYLIRRLRHLFYECFILSLKNNNLAQAESCLFLMRPYHQCYFARFAIFVSRHSPFTRKIPYLLRKYKSKTKKSFRTIKSWICKRPSSERMKQPEHIAQYKSQIEELMK